MHMFKTQPDLRSRTDLNASAFAAAIESGDHQRLADDWMCPVWLVSDAIEASSGSPEQAWSVFAYSLEESRS